MNHHISTRLFIFLLITMLSACGQSGQLYLPKQSAASTQTQTETVK